MTKRCFKCGQEYKLIGATIGLSDGSTLEVKAVELAVKVTDMDNNEFYQDFDLCPDCMEQLLYGDTLPINLTPKATMVN